MVRMQRFHGFVIVIYPVVGMSLVFGQEGIDLETSFPSASWELLVLIADEVKKIDRFNHVVEVALVAR